MLSHLNVDVMANEKGVGHHLRKRIGAGDELSAYGGSLHLPTASVKNSHLAISKKQVIQDIEREQIRKRMATNRQILELTAEAKKLEQAQKELTYFDEEEFAKYLNFKQASVNKVWDVKQRLARSFSLEQSSPVQSVSSHHTLASFGSFSSQKWTCTYNGKLKYAKQ